MGEMSWSSENDQSDEIQQVDTNIIKIMNRKEVRLLIEDSEAVSIPAIAVMQYFVRIFF